MTMPNPGAPGTDAPPGVFDAAEDVAARALRSEAVPDNPNPDAPAAAPGETATPAVPPATDDAPRPLERITEADKGRADIAARFKAKRAAQGGQVEFHGNFQDPSQTYGPYAGQGAPEAPAAPSEEGAPQQPAADLAAPAPAPAAPAPAASPAAPQQPSLTKLRVHGVEMYLPQDQVIAEAQKSLAAGNLLESAKEVLSGARQPVPPPAEPAPDPNAHDPFADLAQTLQLEPDAKVAGAKLKQAIDTAVAPVRQEATREATRQVRLESELRDSQRALQAFERDHPELAADELARDTITAQVQREINADLAAAVNQGVLRELPASQDERNGLHTQLRAFGAPVRSIGDIFTAAGTKYATWRGGTPAPQPQPQPVPQPQPAGAQPAQPASAAPRVELSPDRAQRRANLATQPTAGTAPPRAAAPSPELTMAQRRSAAVMAMRKARGQIVA